MRIDIHAHYFPVRYLDLLDRYGTPAITAFMRRAGMAAADEGVLDARFRNMDRANVDMQVLSISGQFPYFGDESHAVEGAQLGNDLYAEIVRLHADRFAAFACTPLPHIQASIREIERALDELGMVGVTAGTTVMGKSIADPAFDDFYEELNRRKAVLFLHPMGDSAGSALIGSAKLTWPVGAPLEDTVCLLQMMQANIPSRFPDVKIILPHLGGFAPFLMSRLDQLRGQFLPESASMPSVQARWFWYDSVNGNPGALRTTCDEIAPDHVLFGSDYPFWQDDAFVLCADYVRQAGLADADVDGILGGNAQKLLRMDAFGAVNT